MILASGFSSRRISRKIGGNPRVFPVDGSQSAKRVLWFLVFSRILSNLFMTGSPAKASIVLLSFVDNCSSTLGRSCTGILLRIIADLEDYLLARRAFKMTAISMASGERRRREEG